MAEGPGSKNDDHLTPQEAAEILMVSPVTIRQWAQKGILPAQTTAGGHRRFLRTDVEQFARSRGIKLPTPDSILIVDDDQQHNNYLVALFETSVQDIVVYSALDGFVAGRLVQEHKPRVVLLDIIMPGIDGVQVCRSIKSDLATQFTSVVAMTGHHTPELEHRVLEAGAEVLLKKPFPAEEVIAACGFSPDQLHA